MKSYNFANIWRKLLIVFVISFAVIGFAFYSIRQNRLNTPMEDIVAGELSIEELLTLHQGAEGVARFPYANSVFHQLYDLEFLDTLYYFSTTRDYELCEATFNLCVSSYYIQNSKFQLALDVAQLAEAYFKNDHLHQLELSEAWCNIGVAYSKLGDFDRALNYQLDGLELVKKVNNPKQLGYALYNLAGCSVMMQRYDTAKKYIDEAIRYAREYNKEVRGEHSLSTYLGLAGYIYSQLERFSQAIDFVDEAYRIDSLNNNVEGMPSQLLQISAVYLNMGDSYTAHGRLKKALKILEQYPNSQMEAAVNNQIANIEARAGQYDSAEVHLNRAILHYRESGNRYAERNVLRNLAKVHMKTDPELACQDFQDYIAFSDSMHLAEATAQLNEYRVKYETDELELVAEKQRNRTKTIVVISIAMLLLFAGAILVLAYILSSKQKAMQREEQFYKSKNNFFTHITHEFRTPLTVVLGYGQQMRNNTLDLDESIQEVGEMITRQGSQMLSLINQLLDLMKVSSNAIRLKYYTADIVSYVKMVVENYRQLAVDKRVRLTVTSERDNCDVDFVPDYIHKIVRNLVSNAIKFTPQEGFVHVALSFTENDVIIKVSDSGIGIPKEELAHIFDEFYQVSSNGQYKGTGIGLSLVSKVVSILKGTIEVSSESGTGTQFTVTLPRYYDGEKYQGLNANVEEGNELIAAERTDRNRQLPVGVRDSDAPILLIVEDNEDISHYIASQLHNRYQLYYASNGVEGLRVANEVMPDLIICDLMMPEMDGNELCRQIRTSELLNHIPFVMVTAKTTDEDKIQGLRVGADAYLFKPFNVEELNVSVENLISHHRTIKQMIRDLTTHALEMTPSLDAASSNRTELPGGQIEIEQLVPEKTEEGKENGKQPEEITFSEAQQSFLLKLNRTIEALIDKKVAVDVQTIASEICLSSKQLGRKIQSITGETTVNYLAQYRVEKAKHILLEDVEAPVAEVATLCGFEDGAYFSRVFKQVVGETPTQYRKHNG